MGEAGQGRERDLTTIILLFVATVCIGFAALPSSADTLIGGILDLERKCRLIGFALAAMSAAIFLELAGRLGQDEDRG
jgi:hypothetical protein